MTGALLALPGSALAAGDVMITGIGTPASIPAGESATFNVSFNNTEASDVEGALDFSANGATITDVSSAATGVTCSTAAESCDLADTLAMGAFTVSITLKADVSPGSTGMLDVTSMGDGGAEWSYTDSESFDIVDNGGPSNLVAKIGDRTPSSGLLNKWVVKDGTFTAPVTVTNNGAGEAKFVGVSVDVWGSASTDFSPVPPSFSPTLSVTGGDCVVESSTSHSVVCGIASIPAGATKTFTLSVGGLTHLGSVNLSTSIDHKGDDNYDWGGYSYGSMTVTDGTTILPLVAVTGPRSAAGNSTVTFNGEVANAGPGVLSGFLYISATSFKSNGDVWGSGVDRIQSIQSVALNGAACPAVVDGGVAQVDSFRCPVSGIAAGARQNFAVTAKFATAKPDMDASISAELMIPGYPATGAAMWSEANVALNPSKTKDLQLSFTSTPVIGADRLNPVTVTVKNAGNATAENVRLSGELRGVGGTFDAGTLPANCTGITKPQFANCSLGDLAAGASASVTLNVHAGATLGSLVSIFEAWSSDDVFDANPDDDTITQVLEVKKAADIPFTGVKVGKPKAQNVSQLTKSGTSTVVTCPSACKAKVELRLDRKKAEQLGWSKKLKGKAAKKALPYIVLGTGTKSLDKAGEVTVVTKLTKTYKNKVSKLKTSLTLASALTVSSAEAGTKDASFTKVTNQTFKPAKATKPVKKPKR